MKFNWKDILKWLAVILAAIGGNQAYEAATAPEPAPAEYASQAATVLPYEVAVAFSTPEGGGAFPASKDDAGPVLLRVEKPSQDRVKKAFKLDYGELYPSAVVTGFIVVSKPDKETELEPNEPEKE